jgi:major vault protein
MITIPPRNYCVVENPVIRNKEGRIEHDASGQAKLAFADLEIRFNRDPFPLYPGETLKQVIK